MSTNQDSKSPVLVNFLKQGETVECLVNLPSIIHLQTVLVEKFNRTIACSSLDDMTIREFIKNYLDKSEEKAIQRCCEILLYTWNILSVKVKAHGGVLATELAKFNVDESGLTLDNTPATFIFLASHGRGLCSTAIVSLLTETHNSLVQSELPPLEPCNVTIAHLAALTSAQVQSLLLAHTRHSLEESGALREDYDIAAMERRVQDRWKIQIFRVHFSRIKM